MLSLHPSPAELGLCGLLISRGCSPRSHSDPQQGLDQFGEEPRGLLNQAAPGNAEGPILREGLRTSLGDGRGAVL